MRNFAGAAATAALAAVAVIVPLSGTASAAPAHSWSRHVDYGGHHRWCSDFGHEGRWQRDDDFWNDDDDRSCGEHWGGRWNAHYQSTRHWKHRHCAENFWYRGRF